MNKIEKLEKYLKEIALKAILEHPKAKRYAKANCVDHFALVMWQIAENEIVSEILDDVCERNGEEMNWFNQMHDKPFPNEHKNKMRAFCVAIAHEAYTLLRK